MLVNFINKNLNNKEGDLMSQDFSSSPIDTPGGEPIVYQSVLQVTFFTTSIKGSYRNTYLTPLAVTKVGLGFYLPDGTKKFVPLEDVKVSGYIVKVRRSKIDDYQFTLVKLSKSETKDEYKARRSTYLPTVLPYIIDAKKRKLDNIKEDMVMEGKAKTREAKKLEKEIVKIQKQIQKVAKW
jgi:hypothetical protein